MIYLFLGMAFSGIGARLALLAHRGGFLLDDQAQKSDGIHVFEMIGFLFGATALVVSFFMFDWWLPLAAVALGYWFVAPLVVTRNTFGWIYGGQALLTVGSLACSVMILYQFFAG